MFLNEIVSDLKIFGVSRLERMTGLSRSHIYSILNGKTDPSLETIEKLLSPLGYQLSLKRKIMRSNERLLTNEDEDFILWSLTQHGAPLLTKESFPTHLDIDETLIASLDHGRKNAQINTVLPIFIFKNSHKLNCKNIKRRVPDKRYLAYILNLIVHITNDLDIGGKLQELRNEVGSIRHPQRLVKRGKMSEFEKKKFDTVENMIANSWKFKTADSLDGIEERFRKWMTNGI
jgi:transcriptional regulator with XRE-family HTH domain